jgi:hypothetical protein
LLCFVGCGNIRLHSHGATANSCCGAMLNMAAIPTWHYRQI